MHYVVIVLFLNKNLNASRLFCFVLCPCMAFNNVSVQHNGGLLPDIILLIQCDYHRGRTRLNAMKRFCLFCSL